jgi:hypothetical protein
MGFLSGLLGTDIAKSVENIATEWIQTDKETAEAKAIWIKALDPNGKMRRDISNKVSTAYSVYLYTTMGLLLSSAYGVGDTEGTKLAISSLTELFVPITAMFTMIVGASFGTNISNNIKEKREN